MEKLEQKFRISRIIYWTTAMTLAIFLIITEVLFHLRIKPIIKDFTGVAFLRYIFYILGLVILFSTKYIKQMLFSEKNLNDEKILEKLQTNTILHGVCNETAALMGFTLFLLSGNKMDFYIMLIASIFSVITNIPKRDKWDEIIKLNKVT